MQWMQRVIDGLHQRAEILVLHRALVLGIARVVHAVAHRLVLQVALAALVADRAIQRMVDQQEFHHAAARLAHHRAVGVHHHAVGDRIGAGGDRLRRRLLDLDQAHAAIAGDRQALVVAEARNFDAGRLAGLQHGRAGGTSTSMPSMVTLAIRIPGWANSVGEAAWPYSATRPSRYSAVAAGRACAIGGDALFHHRPEMPDQALDRPGRGVAQRADRVALDLPRHLLQRVDFVDGSARPSTMRFITRIIQPVPSRHGVHWPQLSCM